MKRITLADRIRYRFDSSVAKGPSVLVVWVIVSALVVVLFLGLVIVLTRAAPVTDGKAPSFTQQIWTSLLHFLDNGNISNDPIASGWGYVILMLLITLVGIVFSGALTGIITNGLAARLDAMRKGRSFVVEKNHTVILGWSSQIIPVLQELIVANLGSARACIVILADRDKVDMEDEIHAKLPHTHNTDIVCRSGNPIDLVDLELVNPHAASNLVVLAPEEDDPDSQVINAVLAITNNPNRRKEPYHIVAVIHDEHNLEAAKLVGRDEAQFVLTGQLISRITAQTCRQSGLSVVYTELLSFEGNELYFQATNTLAGRTFGEATLAFETSCVIGIRNSSGAVQLKPNSSQILQTSDQLIVIAQDQASIHLSSLKPEINPEAIVQANGAIAQPEKTLILGWNRHGTAIINELDGYVAAGSSLTVMSEVDAQDDISSACRQLKNQTITVQTGDTTDRRNLISLEPTKFDHVIVLAYSDTLTAKRADAKTLVTLLHLRELKTQKNATLGIVSEMLDARNRELAEVTQADDFIVSERLVSLMVAQLSNDWERAAVFSDLFSSEGAELYLKPISDYVKPGLKLDFYTVLEAAKARGELAIGYRLAAISRDSSQNYGVSINPVKTKVLSFSRDDKIIVLA